MLGSIFFKVNHVGRHFFPDFQELCKGFTQILLRFRPILPGFSQNQTFEVLLHPCIPVSFTTVSTDNRTLVNTYTF